jgi:O-antigen ligase
MVVLEYIILAICLCIMALRATFTEGPIVQSLDQPVNLGDNVYSLTISTILISLFAVWLICSFTSKRVRYISSSIEPGLCIFIIAAVIAGITAANKRSAIDASLMLLSPLLMIVMLVQILDSRTKTKLVLICVAALGVVGAYQCAEQYFYTNKMMIQQYQQDPQFMLQPLGIAPDTFAHMLFEHRLFSKGIHGYFTTSNSAGSFALLASFAAIILFAGILKDRKGDKSLPARFLIVGAAMGFAIFGLLITLSKGAIIAFAVAVGIFAAHFLFSRLLKRYRKVVVVFCLMSALGCGGLVVAYGLENDTLPGGNSMLVRWQYWVGAWQMYTDNALTGVGPGNFAAHYPQYKAAGAPLETVADPHNFLLSVLTQYGPLGLLGFLAMIILPLWKVFFADVRRKVPDVADSARPSYKSIALVFGVVISLGLLVLRPMVMKIPAGVSFAEKQAAFIMLYVLVVLVFAVAFASFAFAGEPKGRQDGDIVTVGLFCAVLGLLVHNLIDFAIFEPGVLMAFAALLACLIAMQQYEERRDYIGAKPNIAVRVGVIIVAIAMVYGALVYGIVPAAKSVAKIKRAQRAIAYGRYDIGYDFLNDAAIDDKLNPAISSMDAQICVEGYLVGGKVDKEALVVAEERLIEAVRRNRMDYKNFGRLTEVYILLAETAEQEKDYLEKAFGSALRAAELYPGSGRLTYATGELAERLGHDEIAAEYYGKAVEIENAYREQFRVMYPGKEVFSRLGQEKYEAAKQRFNELFGP